jgi:hypothetical protein
VTAFPLAVTPPAGVEADAGADAVTKPSPPRAACPPASAERRATSAGDRRGLRGMIEPIVLALMCSAAVAFYSLMSGERGGTRVPARGRRR